MAWSYAVQLITGTLMDRAMSPAQVVGVLSTPWAELTGQGTVGNWEVRRNGFPRKGEGVELWYDDSASRRLYVRVYHTADGVWGLSGGSPLELMCFVLRGSLALSC